MQRRLPKFAGSVLVLAALGGIIWASAGDLNPPPGPITSTMKTLSDVEPRVAVQSLTGDATSEYTIGASGSYYLTGNVVGESGKSGIRITADGVTIDLSGHTLEGVDGSTHGIDVPSARDNIVVKNGVVRGRAVTACG